jgi:hypothetical protein
MVQVTPFGPPKWTCPDCDRTNDMEERPTKGHSVRRKCSGCDEYSEITSLREDSSNNTGPLTWIISICIVITLFFPPFIIIVIGLVILLILGKIFSPSSEESTDSD